MNYHPLGGYAAQVMVESAWLARTDWTAEDCEEIGCRTTDLTRLDAANYTCPKCGRVYASADLEPFRRSPADAGGAR